MISEKDINSYIKQFNVSREVAIKEIEEIMLDEYKKNGEELEEVYEGIIRNSYPL